MTEAKRACYAYLAWLTAAGIGPYSVRIEGDRYTVEAPGVEPVTYGPGPVPMFQIVE